MASNPYSLVFGKEPSMHIVRIAQITDIVQAFSADIPPHQAYILTGLRGSGKTVMLSDVAKELKKDSDWIVVELNPERDMLQALAAKLYGDSSLSSIFKGLKIDLSLFGLGVEIEESTPILDIEVAISELLQRVKKKRKKVLITVDEVINNENMRIFAASFQILLREDLPVFLLMTGLHQNVDDLQNEKSLTFLLRAPKINMEPLNFGAMANNYKTSMNLDDETANKLAKMTQGYPFAFQALGYLYWEKRGKPEDVIPALRQYLEDFVYRKIWSELSTKDKELAVAIAMVKSGKVSEIKEVMNGSAASFGPYRDRLIKKDLIDGSEHGIVKFTLPYFREFAHENM